MVTIVIFLLAISFLPYLVKRIFFIQRFASCMKIPVKFPITGNLSRLKIVTSVMIRIERKKEMILLSWAIFLRFI